MTPRSPDDPFVLDHKEDLQLVGEEIADHFDSRMALARLAHGLDWLYRSVREQETIARARAAKNDVQIQIIGSIVDNVPTGLLSCAFQWYAVSACNYAQLVGWLATGDSAEAKSYMARVIPRLHRYRNKVAAHFALADPRRDNEADLAASVMTHVVYVGGRLCAAALTPVVKVDGNEIGVTEDMSWSLTLAHERLVPRFWPDGLPEAHASLKVPPGKTTLMVSWSDLLGDEGGAEGAG